MEREKLKSRLGFILLSAGCAIGIGNVWKFPYMAGQGGGGAFVLFYLLFLVILGLPIMTMEFAVGRASHKSPVRAYQALEKPGQKWHIHGYFTLIGCYLLMMFYTTVAGWMLHYFYMTAAGKLVGLDADQVAGKFTEMLASPLTMGFWMVVVVAIGIFVCARGLQNGLEKVTKVMMIALLVIMVVLAVNSMFMPGAKEGLTFFLVPDFERMKEVGIVNTLVGAMNQAFFTLSLGIGAMAIFGSYIGKEHALLGESVRVVVLDTFVAITAGLIIFPACFTYGVDQTSGPSLIFITLPNIFANMAMGRLWGSLFFLFMAFAALSTVLAVFENIICCGMELTGWNRQKSSLVNFFLIIALSLPCVLCYNVWAWDGFAIFGGAVLDVEDFLVSNLFLPLGSLVYLLFCVTRYGWGWDNYKKEVNTGKGLKMHDWMRGYLTYGLPLIPAFADVLAAGADGEPAAVAADVGEDLRRGFGVDLADEVLVDVILFLETEVFHRLCIVALDLFLRVAEVLAQLVGTAGAEGEVDGGAGNIPQLMHHVGHVGHEIVVIAFAGIALRAEQMMRTKYDAHAFSPGMRFRRFRPMAQARTALTMAVGMKGRTQAVIPTAMVLWATTTNIATPTT